jgi:LacI family transcriptional regulator
VAVTIKEVAQEANVSVASVSRALNGHGNVTEETRNRILRVASKLRYMPHASARSLSTQRTQTIGALLPDLYGEFFSELIRGIDLAARARGLHLLVSSSHGDATEAAAALRAMRGRVDGLLVMSPHVDAGFLRENLPDDLPLVLMNTPVRDMSHPSLNVDNYGGAYAMVRHLIGCGHARVALIEGPPQNFDASERRRGYCAALAKFAPKSAIQVLPGDFTEEAGHRAGHEVARMTPRPQAVFAANDMMAVGCMIALRACGLRVPEDVAVAGFDDIPIARYVAPPLTTVRTRIAEFGGGAMERLAGLIEGTESEGGASRIGECELVVRASCGARRGNDPVPQPELATQEHPIQRTPGGTA